MYKFTKKGGGGEGERARVKKCNIRPRKSVTPQDDPAGCGVILRGHTLAGSNMMRARQKI